MISCEWSEIHMFSNLSQNILSGWNKNGSEKKRRWILPSRCPEHRIACIAQAPLSRPALPSVPPALPSAQSHRPPVRGDQRGPTAEGVQTSDDFFGSPRIRSSLSSPIYSNFEQQRYLVVEKNWEFEQHEWSEWEVEAAGIRIWWTRGQGLAIRSIRMRIYFTSNHVYFTFTNDIPMINRIWPTSKNEDLTHTKLGFQPQESCISRASAVPFQRSAGRVIDGPRWSKDLETRPQPWKILEKSSISVEEPTRLYWYSMIPID